jgi:predicted O-methyltransferase YrrM
MKDMDPIDIALSVKGWTSVAKLSMLRDLLDRTNNLPGDILEIGSAWGRSTILLGLSSDKIIWSIDPHTGGRAFLEKGEEQNSYGDFIRNLDYAGIRSKVNILRYTTEAVVANGLMPKNTQVSFAFIDGLHTPDAVELDYYFAFSRLVVDGIMVFDDYFEPTVSDYAKKIDELTEKSTLHLVKDQVSKLVYVLK